VSAVMTADPCDRVTPTATTCPKVTRLLSERHQEAVFVVEPDGRLVGIISRADVLRAVAEAFPGHEASDRGAFAVDPRGPRCHADPIAPVVSVGAELPQVVDAVCSTRLKPGDRRG